ncbi:uncharacterized protein LOC111404105 isoform X1 [Olea europaea var. sylvestris]|uniref:Uncharacterized protein LOC111404105 isoform X1 n=1 Tax=Olea europaea subsp. europaea TaxID=158383 RepID=A0A8S0RX26_OLEEU|nr:uncharacterized protein LOC111404105 isoform X1 [Olea europaea var. sylvestris]CAA2984651.1 uncharacterized protein LOC111404105 isoform X1 [Olea europaea subsp. europaea]
MMVHRVSVFLCYIPVFISAATITLDSIEIYKTHDWLPSKPTVYFLCKGENKTILPDVKEKLLLYTFKGEESWQPLTELQDKKCKRCGFYEEDIIKSDDVFDEWEFCASDFMKSDGKYIHLKDKEINATFLCPECVPFGNASGHSSTSNNSSGGMHWALIVLISAVVSTVFIAGLVTAFKFWQKRKRQQEQARFLKLFEEGDDIEDEFGIGPLGSEV